MQCVRVHWGEYEVASCLYVPLHDITSIPDIIPQISTNRENHFLIARQSHLQAHARHVFVRACMRVCTQTIIVTTTQVYADRVDGAHALRVTRDALFLDQIPTPNTATDDSMRM